MNLRDQFLRIRALVAPHRVERELDEELAFHIERETQKHIAAGLTPAAARARARSRFGPAQLLDAPLGFNPALMLETMEGRVERALVNLQDGLGDLLNALRDRPAVQRLGLQRPKDEQVERARQKIRDGVSSHGVG